MKTRLPSPARARGFTLIELLIGTMIMFVVVIGALQMYSRSNKIAADQQQLIDIQTDVRAAMYFLSRDARMIGTGLPASLGGYVLQGTDNETISGTTETPDRLRVMGNMETPLALSISDYNGSSANVTLADYSLESYPYTDAFFVGKTVLVVPSAASTSEGIVTRVITHVTHSSGGTNEKFNFSPGQAPGINPPGGLSDVCGDDEFTGGTVMFSDVREYWLDVTGNASGLTAGANGYIGGGLGGVLYLTVNDTYYPIAQNIETIQFQYNGDFDGDSSGVMDGFTNWNSSWTKAQIAKIRQIRILIVGRTPNVFASVGHNTGTSNALYCRPAVANTSAVTTPDWHKRFLMESTANIRNLSLNLFNSGLR